MGLLGFAKTPIIFIVIIMIEHGLVIVEVIHFNCMDVL